MSRSTPVTIVQRRVALQDPQDCTDNADTLALFEALFDALVRRKAGGGQGGEYEPALARSWTLSDDGRRWRFRLREGLRFHDGTPVDAEVMRASIARMQRPDVGATLGAPAVWGQYLGGARIEALDSGTLEIETVEPCADLLDILVSGYALPPGLVDQPDFLENPVGTGAYRYAGQLEGGGIVMSRNPNWWGGTPRNEILHWRAVADPAERAERVADGRALVATKLPPDLVAGDAVTCIRHIDPTSILYLLNAARGPCADARVRRALYLAVDRGALIDEVLAGAGRPLLGFVSPSHPGAVPVDPELAFDRAEARRLLAEAGHGDGLVIHVDCPTRLPDEALALTEALGRQLATVGITLERHVTEDRTRYAEQVRDKKIHDMCLFDSSPISTFRVLLEKIDSRMKGSWWQGYRNAEVEALLDASRCEPDPAAREELHRRSFEALLADPPWLVLYNHLFAVALAGRHPDWTMRSDGVLDVVTLPEF